MIQKILLNVKDLRTHLSLEEGTAKVIDGVDFVVREGETLGLTGESGSGKSILALSLLKLVEPSGKIVGGEVWFNDRDLLTLSTEELNKVRGEEIALIPQNPTRALDPLIIVGSQSGEVLEEHRAMKREQIKEKVLEYLGTVGLPDPKKSYASYASEFSHGMNQRVMISAALLCAPSLLIADEPTSSLDVTVQRQVLELLKDINTSFDLSMIYITHDLGVIAEMADRVAVMYAGKIVECADVVTIFENPLHPYTRGLLGSLLRADKRINRHELTYIEGELPGVFYRPSHCAFAPRCPYAAPSCYQQMPSMIRVKEDHSVRCLRLDYVE